MEESLKDGQFITFDFKGVDTVSHAFADECFGKLLLTWELADLKSKSTFKNTNELVKTVIAFTLKERISITDKYRPLFNFR